MNTCRCKHPQLTTRPGGLFCAACGKPVKAAKFEGTRAPNRAIIPPEKAEALREIHNLRREFNAKLDRLKADILKA